MRPSAAVAACGLLTACASVDGPLPAPSLNGYLAEEDISRVVDMTPVAVGIDDARQLVEPGTDRWWLAIAHAELRPPEAAQHFDCALGTRLADRPRPALARLLGRLLADADRLTREAAARYGHRSRPIVRQPGLEPCQRITPEMRRSPSYPAAGAVAGTLFGETFAALAPDRADQTRRIGREIGVSRRVCRMNSALDVEGGERAARALYPLISASPEFRADLEAARMEVAAARIEGLRNPSCAAERRALGFRPDAG